MFYLKSQAANLSFTCSSRLIPTRIILIYSNLRVEQIKMPLGTTRKKRILT